MSASHNNETADEGQGLVVLSLFDGISCGMVALKRAGIAVKRYYAAEIDKFAIQVSEDNWPDIIRLGDVENWREWDIDWSTITLLIGGSPCQGFSFAGKQLAFDDPRSKLFFVYVDILNHIEAVQGRDIKFLLENVRMKQEHQDVISAYLDVKPVCINSALVSAQNRVRYYWCSWNVAQPDDRNIELKDIIVDGHVNRVKAYCIDANYHKGGNLKSYFEKRRRQLIFTKPIHRGSIVGRKVDSKGVRRDNDKNIPMVQCLEVRKNSKDKVNCLTGVAKDNVITPLGVGRYVDVYGNDLEYRNMYPIECERAQCLPDNYTSAVSNSQRYKQCGNGWNVDTIVHILNEMEAAA